MSPELSEIDDKTVSQGSKTGLYKSLSGVTVVIVAIIYLQSMSLL